MTRSVLLALACMPPMTALAAPVINEIMYRPGLSFPEPESLEFVEIHNPDPTAVDLSQWRISGGVDFVFPAGTLLAAGGHLVVAADPAALAAATGLSGIRGPWSADQRLSNSGESLVLSRPDPTGWVAVDTVSYADEGDWAFRAWDATNGWQWITPTRGGGTSLERRNPRLRVDSGQAWGDSGVVGGTPGAANRLLSDDLAPIIRRVQHAPAVPRDDDPVTISCELADELPAGSLLATLHWRDATSSTPGAFQTLAMTNDGNGRFSATLAALPDKTIVEFYVHASDGAKSRTWPAPGSQGQTANCAYQVDNEVVLGTAPTYRLVLTAAENAAYNALAALYDGAGGIETVPGGDRVFNTTFIATEGGETTIRYRAGMRIRGQSSRKFVHKPLRVSFPADDPWDGISKFNLNPKYPWVQFLGMRLFQAAGLPASDASPVELRRNGVESVTGSGTDPDYGRWVRIAAVDGDLADRHWPEGTEVQIYRKNEQATGWSSNFPVPATPDGNYSGWSKHSRGDRNDWSDVIAFSELWQTVATPYFTGADPGNVAAGTWTGVPFSDADFDTLSTVVDFDQMARWFAVMTLLNNREKNLSTGSDNDYAAAWVGDGTHRRLQLLPYDLDNLLGKGDAAAGPGFGGLYNMTDVSDVFEPLLPLIGDEGRPGNPRFRAKYHQAIRELAGSVFDADTTGSPYPPFHAFIDNHLGDWVPPSVRDELKTYMTQRQNYLLGLVGAGKITPPAPTSTATLTRAPAGHLRINEVLAVNTATRQESGAFPDFIELRNSGSTGIALAGHSISDGSNSYVFPSGSGNVPAGGFRLVSSTTLGFGLGASGDTVQLRDGAGSLLDEVVFGPQIADLSIARGATDPDTWGLATPTLNAANGETLVPSTPHQVRLNEWAGNTDYRLGDDFVELHNAATAPAALGGMRLTDGIVAYPSRFTFPALSFLGAGAFVEIDSDRLGFKLDGRFENLWLCGADGTIASQATLVSQLADHSTGLSPDGGTAWATFPVPTPGLSNATLIPGAAELFAGLRVTEVMFAPNTSGDFEFVELQNISPVPLALDGVRFTSGISYTFPAGTTLNPGAYVVVCKNRTSFLNRYPGRSAILAPGVFTGSLDNSGETLALTLPAPGHLNLLRFRYEPSWYPAAAGGGRSLHTRDPRATPPAEWGNSGTWTASATLHGSPGTGEPPVVTSTLAVGGIVNAAFSYVIAATGMPATFAASGLPLGLGLDGGTGLISGSPSQAGSFPVQISATGPAGTAQATLVLTVLPYGPLDHFRWDLLPASTEAGAPFVARLTARDAGGRIKLDHAGGIGLRAFATRPDASPVVITEATDGSEDQFELQNVTTESADTSGWFVVVSDSASNINARNSLSFFLPPTLGGGAVLRVSDANTTGRTYFGADIRWSHTSPNGWIMLFDSSLRLRDFVVFGRWNAGQLASLSVTVNDRTVSPVALGQWSGPATPGDPANSNPNFWQRGGPGDQNLAADWTRSSTTASLGSPNPALALPWVLKSPLPLTPDTATFTAGEFLGSLAIGTPASEVTLEAFDAFGRFGVSANPIAVLPASTGTDGDGDGMPDLWESANGLAPADPTDAARDDDGDGQRNLDEYRAGTDPRSASSVFKITDISHDSENGTVSIHWTAVAGKLYQVSASPNLTNWTPIANRLAEADGSQAVQIPAGAGPARFFRVEIAP